MNSDDTHTPEMGKLADNYEVASDERREIDRNLTRLLAPTPRTDEAENEAGEFCGDSAVVSAGLARTLERELAAAQAELAALRAAQEWRPIEEAPKDGTNVLATDGTDQLVVWWNRADKEWFWMDEEVEFTLTHFRPLQPPLPKGGEGND